MRSRRRLLVATAAAVVLIAAVAATTGDRPIDPDALTPEARYAAVQEILERRNDAILAGDRAAWLADIDDRNPDLVAQQGIAYDNLQELPISRFGLEALPLELTDAALQDRYDVPAFAAAVVLRYQYDGFDAAPTARPMGVTFVLRNGRWRIASETDVLDRLPPGAEAEPWWRVPVTAQRRGQVMVLTDPQSDAGPILQAGEQALSELARLGVGDPGGLIIYAAGDARMLTTFLDPQRGQRLEWTRAAALPTYPDVVDWLDRGAGSPPGDPSPVGSRIVLNPAALGGEELPRVIRHEAAHAATQGLVRDGAPVWLVEGFAEWVAYADAPADRPADADLAALLADPAFPADLPGNGRFFLGNQTLNYTVAWLACRYIAEIAGPETLRALFGDLATVADPEDTPREQRRAIEARLGVTEAEFLVGLRQWIRSAVPLS